jgi:uncharacterized membrane protein (UPF0127 family)
MRLDTSLTCASLFFFFAVSAGCAGNEPLKTIQLEIGGREFTLEVADTPQTRARGLMYRTSLAENAGMLFVFPADSQESFWMENTDIPLSLAYISSSGEIREIFDLTPRSRRAVQSTYAVRYAIEVNQGVFEKLNVLPGHVLKIPPLPSRVRS